ncbi:MAG TPA: phospholipase C, phosphocholine-specific [Caulobacteraceae bacterium]|nr:phospholipase C, phosphocholine-specific [Caulobacteraceae bacterium]
MTGAAGGRRDFLKLAAGAAAGASGLPPAIARALALPANRVSGTIQDVEHIVVLMQENRSFDHYFGTLRGVRGYGDPRAITLPGGQPVWRQPTKDAEAVVSPFHLESDASRAQTLYSLDHSWKASHARWKHYDAWISVKGPLTMGHFNRADIPFYHALADAFTICDGYHCSIFGPTNPNRLFLFSGTSGLSAGDDSRIVVENPPEETNDTADPRNDAQAFPGVAWTTYAERLQAAGVSWRVYQEWDNYGDNGLAYFSRFRGIGPDSVLYQRGRAWAAGSNAHNTATSEGEHLVAEFAADVASGRLPQVSWIVAPYRLCEHPQASPARGEYLTARLLAALAANPEVWAKTAFFLTYDENDGFFDHVPPIIPAAGPALGKSTVEATGEVYHGEPVGFGPRVPMLAVSPWTKGGYVNSQAFDHTSLIRFIEARFGVREPNISPWRRTVSGDLTSAFDFAAPDRRRIRPLPDASKLQAVPDAELAGKLPWPQAPVGARPLPRQEPGQRPARALPYAFEVGARVEPDGLTLAIRNTGAAGAGFILYAAGGGEPRFYTVEAAKSLEDRIALDAGDYRFTLHGPNGFLRGFGGQAASPVRIEALGRFDPARGRLNIVLSNGDAAPAVLQVTPNAYAAAPARRFRLAPGATVIDAWDVRASGHWYDFSVTSPLEPSFERRIAGHGEDGRPSISDPLFGSPA